LRDEGASARSVLPGDVGDVDGDDAAAAVATGDVDTAVAVSMLDAGTGGCASSTFAARLASFLIRRLRTLSPSAGAAVIVAETLLAFASAVSSDFDFFFLRRLVVSVVSLVLPVNAHTEAAQLRTYHAQHHQMHSPATAASGTTAMLCCLSASPVLLDLRLDLRVASLVSAGMVVVVVLDTLGVLAVAAVVVVVVVVVAVGAVTVVVVAVVVVVVSSVGMCNNST
jgi:hypothetical protein